LKEEHPKLKQVHERVSKKLIPTQHPSASALTSRINAESLSKNLKQSFSKISISGMEFGQQEES
jgi:hypothetical protein